MENNEKNLKALNDVYKNAHIALQSISDLLPNVEDKGLKAELKRQSDGYDGFINELSNYMAEKEIEPKDINFMKKAMLWSSIKMKTLINNSKNQIAEMMIKGTVMGITELTAMKNEKKTLDKEVVEYIEKLLVLEEEYNEKLKKYL